MASGKVFQSANLQRVVGYDTQSQELTLEFVSGQTYTYSSIPFSVYYGLISASDPGGYFSKNVRGKFSYVRLDP